MSIEEPTTWQGQWQIITKNGVLTSEILLRTIWVTLKLILIAIIFGIAFLLMAMALYQVVLWFFLYWQPAYTIFIKAVNLPHAPRKLIQAPIPLSRIPILAIKFLLATYLLYLGLQILITIGFCGQNFIFC